VDNYREGIYVTIYALTNLAMLAGSTRGTLAHVSSLRHDVARGTVLTRFSDAGVQRFLAIPAGELRRAYAPVIRRFVLLHRVVVVLVIVLVLDFVVVVALFTETAFPRVLLRSPLIDRRAMRTTTPDYVHPALAASVLAALASLLQSPALAAVAQVLLEDRLARRAVLARQIGARIVAAFLHAVALEDVLVVTHVEVHVDSVDL